MGSHALQQGKRKRHCGAVVAGIMLLHAGLLAWGAWRNSPTYDEVAHLPAGIRYWTSGRFRLYCVNPPLPRLVASLPVLAVGAKTDWANCDRPLQHRPEFQVGRDFVNLNGERSFWLYCLARWACIPFSLLGGYICFRWAQMLYGVGAGIVALILWCFSPTVLAHGQLITSDVAASALGLTACYTFWHWLRRPDWPRAVAAGVLLGLTQLTKTTWIVLFGLWPLLWLVWAVWEGKEAWRRDRLSQACHLGVMLLLALYVLNMGYGFEGVFRRLGEFEFRSAALGRPSGNARPPAGREGWNRFAGSWLEAVPVPLPEYYVLGIDLQKRGLETERWCYLRRRWRNRGWWYYYLYSLAVKMPLGSWILIWLALVVGLCRPGYAASRRDELVLTLPLVVVLVLVSSQTRINAHLRYILPIFPFAFIWMSKVARAFGRRDGRLASLTAMALLWSVTSSLWIYPHSLSYFNELAGGPSCGGDHLLGCNVEWGQDLFYLKRWLDKHPEARPIHLAYYLNHLVDARIAGIEYLKAPRGPRKGPDGQEDPERMGPKPGWYAVSVNLQRKYTQEYAYFGRFVPIGTAGYTILIYHVSVEQANRVRRELRLPELSTPNR